MFLTKNGIACVEHDTHFRKWIEEAGRLDHDWTVLQLLSMYIDRKRDIVDVGANIGTHSFFYSRLTLGNVYSFEINPVAFECLVFNCPCCICLPIGLSNRPEIVSLAMNENVGASHILGDHQGQSSNETNQFLCTTLDSFGFGNLGFIKIDVEGYEANVIRGSRATLSKNRPLLWIEVNEGHLARFGDSPQTLALELRESGYIPYLSKGKWPQGDTLFAPLEDICRLKNQHQELKSIINVEFYQKEYSDAIQSFIAAFSKPEA